MGNKCLTTNIIYDSITYMLQVCSSNTSRRKRWYVNDLCMVSYNLRKKVLKIGIRKTSSVEAEIENKKQQYQHFYTISTTTIGCLMKKQLEILTWVTSSRKLKYLAENFLKIKAQH